MNSVNPDNPKRSEVLKYLGSPASLSALGLTLVAVITAFVSLKTIQTGKETDWWTGYLQGLSTTLLGIALPVFLINRLVEKQTERLFFELQKPAEQVALRSLGNLLDSRKPWLPRVNAPSSLQWHRIERTANLFDRVITLCDAINPGSNDTDLQRSVVTLRESYFSWVNCFEMLQDQVRLNSPEEERASTYSLLQGLTEKLEESAKSLRHELLSRHPGEGVLGLRSV